VPRLFWIAFALLGGGLFLLILNDSSGETFWLENDVFARALYLGVLVMVLAAGLIGRGMGFGSFTRNLAIWVFVVVVLVAGYQYRYELQDVASRLTAGLVPGSPYSAFDAEGRETFVLEKLPSGHFEVRATVNGAVVQFVVDTGATATVLSSGDAAAAGLDPSTLSYSVRVMTANGPAMAAPVAVEEIRIGNIVRNRMPVLIAERGRLDRSLLGMNFIGSLSGFDVRGDRLILRD
jgi:aspartyl protease family protein